MQSKIWYKWIILIGCFLLMAFPFSIVNSIQPLFMSSVVENLGCSISAFSLIFTISAAVIAIASPLIGYLIKKINLKIIMTISAILVGSGFLSYGFAKNITEFYTIAVFIAIGMAGLTSIPIATVITNWFGEWRGTAMGIAFAGAGMGTFFWMQIVSDKIIEFGYEKTYLFLGLIILMIAVPVSLFIMKLSPHSSDKNNFIRRVLEDNPNIKINNKSSLSNLWTNKTFWRFTIGLLFLGITVSGVQIHVQSYLSSLGYGLEYGANIGSTLAISALVGSILGGAVFDSMKTKYAILFFSGLNFIAICLLFFMEQSTIPYVFAIIFGLSLCMPSLWPAYGVGKLFSKENYAAILGIAQLFFTVGGGIGPLFSGFMADIIGYSFAWGIYLIFTIGYIFLFI